MLSPRHAICCSVRNMLSEYMRGERPQTRWRALVLLFRTEQLMTRKSSSPILRLLFSSRPLLPLVVFSATHKKPQRTIPLVDGAARWWPFRSQERAPDPQRLRRFGRRLDQSGKFFPNGLQISGLSSVLSTPIQEQPPQRYCGLLWLAPQLVELHHGLASFDPPWVSPDPVAVKHRVALKE